MSHTSESLWCCSLFKTSVEDHGERGIAIGIGRDEKFGLFFALEFRAIAARHEAKFKNLTDIPLQINVTQAIHFCPWCGKCLREFYADKSSRLPVQHDTLLDR